MTSASTPARNATASSSPFGWMLSGAIITGALVFAFAVPIEWITAFKAALPAQMAWRFSRASGLIAYLLLTGSLGWGLVLSTRISKEVTPPPEVLALHNAVSWAALGLAGLHGLALLLDTYFTYSLIDVLIPFAGPYKPFWVGLGILAFYSSLLAAMSFTWRSWLGQRGWRILHLMIFPAFVLVTVHGFISGTDSSRIGMLAVYVLAVLAILFLVNYRLLVDRRGRKPQV
ncbi:MAG: ferric reductase-like transmembrane domain-containing protein [Anaerolineae bacterium]|nr:ferric reductase-like transmembrane domain-containing protein [Anaerolineae bacterium]